MIQFREGHYACATARNLAWIDPDICQNSRKWRDLWSIRPRLMVIREFRIDGKTARVIHRHSGWHLPINLSWFTGGYEQPVIHKTPFYWYVFAIPIWAATLCRSETAGDLRLRTTNGLRDIRWALLTLVGAIALATALLVVLIGPPLHLAAKGTGSVAAALAFVGVVVTAGVTVIGLAVTQQSARDADHQLRLDAAMRAGESFSPTGKEMPGSASIASSLLALTKLDNADLAIALLIDFWKPEIEEKVSPEAAILVVDAALRSGRPNTQLVAADLLCRNAKHLNCCKPLHWPSFIDGTWDTSFSPKIKLLLVDGLTLMTLAQKKVTEPALRQIAVRLYGIFAAEDPSDTVRGCIATLIKALLPALDRLGYENLMEGNQQVFLADLDAAGPQAEDNPDEYLARMVKNRAAELSKWAEPCARYEPDRETAVLGGAAPHAPILHSRKRRRARAATN